MVDRDGGYKHLFISIPIFGLSLELLTIGIAKTRLKVALKLLTSFDDFRKMDENCLEFSL